MKIIELDTKTIKPYKSNPRKISQVAIDKVANSIKEFGWKQPIVVDKNYVIIVGHTRLLAAKKLKLSVVPVTIASDLDDAKIKAYRLADNRTNEESEWDFDFLKTEFTDLTDVDFDLSLTGFDELEIDNIFPDNNESLEEEGDIPEVAEDAVSCLGDIWILGDHRIMCGDSTNIDSVEKLMNGELAHMVFTDPPYNANYSSRVDKNKRKPLGGIKNDNMSNNDYFCFLTDINSSINIFIKDGASIYECIDWKSYPVLVKVFVNLFNQKSMIIWNKNYFGLGTYYRTKHEIIIFGVKGEKINIWKANHDEMDVWDIKREKVNEYVHPTQKPVEIPARAIKNSSNKNNIVLDLFGWSGSTLIACEQTKRKCCMMELDPKYCDVIIKRWQNLTGKDAVHEENGKKFQES